MRETRADWLSVVTLAGQLARAAEDPLRQAEGGAAGFQRDLLTLASTLRDLQAESFPATAASARTMAAAFLALARGFAHPAWSPEARTACAAFLRIGAETLDRLIAELRTREAGVWRGQSGERDED